VIFLALDVTFSHERGGSILVEREGMEKQEIDEASKKGKNGKVKYTKR